MTAFFSKLLLIPFIFSIYSPSRLINEKRHPLHVSTTEINFNPKEKSLEISCRIFTDDFENILAKKFKAKTDLSKPSMQKEMDELIKKYIAAHLIFNVDGKIKKANYIGFEIDHEATNVYIEIVDINNFKNLNVSNTILYDLFDDQMNILHVENSGSRKSVRANYPNSTLAVKF